MILLGRSVVVRGGGEGGRGKGGEKGDGEKRGGGGGERGGRGEGIETRRVCVCMCVCVCVCALPWKWIGLKNVPHVLEVDWLIWKCIGLSL